MYNGLNMSKKVTINLIIIFFLLLCFPLIWYYNQRLNYRKFFTLNTKFSLSSNEEKKEDLSSIPEILNILKGKNISAGLYDDMVTEPSFVVLGRRIVTINGKIDVYEYSSNSDAAKLLKKLQTQPSDTIDMKSKIDLSRVYVYKNLLIQDQTTSNEIKLILEENKK